MDIAALQLSVDSEPVRRATKVLDSFSAAADKAGAATGKSTGSISKMAEDYARASRHIDQASTAAARAVAANDNVARSSAGVARAVQNADAHVAAYQKHLATLPSAATQAASGLDRVTKASNDNANAMRANAGNIAAQFQDIGVTAAMGMNPLLIALQQGTQLSGVLAQTGGGAFATIKAAIAQVISPASLLTVGFVAVAAAAVQMGMSLFNSGSEAEKLADKLDNVKFATDAVGNAQSILGGVMDLTTGKIANQSRALMGLAQAQLLVARVQAQARAAEARRGIEAIQDRKLVFDGGFGGGINIRRRDRDGRDVISQQMLAGTIDAQKAVQQLDQLRRIGRMSEDDWIAATQAVANYGLELKNIESFSAADRMLNGAGTAADRALLLKPDTGGGRQSGERAAKISDEARAMQERTRAADQYITSLTDEVAKIGLSEEALRRYEVTQALAKATTDKQREAIIALSAEREKGLRALRQQQDLETAQKALADNRKSIAGGIDIELQTMGLVGAERDREILRIQRQIEITDILAKIKKAEADGNAALADTYRQLAEATEEGYAKQLQLVDGTEAINRQRKALDEARSAAKGFFAEWMNGIRNGDNLFKAFANSVINGINRMIDRMMDRAIDDFFDKFDRANQGGGGGFWSKLFDFGNSVAMAYATGGAKTDNGGSALKFASKNANGNVFTDSGIMRFAMGGAFTNQIIDNPTLFKFANGGKFGLMGEAGPEAVMPLTRGANGKLGVQAQGGGGKPTIVFSPEITNHNNFEGAVGMDSLVAMNRQMSQQTVSQIRRELQSMLDQLDRDGSIIS